MGLENIGGWELITLILLGLFIFGPDKLPKAIADGLRMLRQLRDMARNATSDLSKELGTDIQLEDLHPRTFVRKHLLSEEDEAALRRPLEEAYRDLRQTTRELDPRVDDPEPATRAKSNGGSRHHAYDADAT
jgi:sec-independent protein translocase protein TatB